MTEATPDAASRRMTAEIWQRLRTRLGEDHARGCQGRNYDCTCGFDNDGDKLVEDAIACIATLETELAQARKAPESAEVAEMVTKLRLQRPTEQVGKQHYSLEETVTNMAQAADLLTRLIRERDAAIARAEAAEKSTPIFGDEEITNLRAKLAEAERERDIWANDRWGSLENWKARALAAERERDALLKDDTARKNHISAIAAANSRTIEAISRAPAAIAELAKPENISDAMVLALGTELSFRIIGEETNDDRFRRAIAAALRALANSTDAETEK